MSQQKTSPETHEKMGVMWNGGWDDYLVDVSDVIDDPTEVKNPFPDTIVDGKTYIRTCFSGKFSQRFPGKAIRKVSHLGGGD